MHCQDKQPAVCCLALLRLNIFESSVFARDFGRVVVYMPVVQPYSSSSPEICIKALEGQNSLLFRAREC